MVMYQAGRTTKYPELPPEEGFRYHYLGGGDEVGNVGIMLEDTKATKLLLDYGLAPTDPPRYPNEAPPVKDAVITHSHIDHLGMAPWLCANHRTRLHGTALTAEISHAMWNDCHKVSRIEGYPLAWDKRDIETALNLWNIHEFDNSWIHHNWNLTLRRAGHIPGAAMLEIETENKSILMTGDFDTRDHPLTKGAEPRNVDTVFVEGTYGGRNHPNLDEEVKRFTDRIVEVVDRGGTALVPAFANGRTQDIVMRLHKFLPEMDVHVNGMGKHIAKLQMEHPESLRNPQELEDAWRWAKKISSKSDRNKALNADIIVSTSGMLDGGPALWFLNRLRHDMKNAVLFTGYQARDSGGRNLLEKGRLPIFGNMTEVPLELDQFSFSTHAGHDEIVRFVQECKAEEVVLYHTDPNHARPHLVEELEELNFKVHSPVNGVSGILS